MVKFFNTKQIFITIRKIPREKGFFILTFITNCYISAKNIREIDVSGTEPDMAFIPPTD